MDTVKQEKSNVLVIAVMFLLFFMIAFVTNFAGSMGVIVKTQFGASNALSQLGTLANFIAYACFGIPVGLILKRRGYKFTSLLATIVGFVGVGIQFASGYVDPSIAFGIYVLGAFVAGISMCLLNTTVNPMLNTLGGGGNRGNQLIQTGGSLNSLAATLTPMLAGSMISEITKDTSLKAVTPLLLIALAIFAASFVIVWFTQLTEPETEKSDVLAGIKGALGYRQLVLGIVAIFFYVGIEVGIPGQLLFYLSEPVAEGGVLGSAVIAGLIAGVYWLLMLVGRFVSAFISGKVSSRMQLTVTSSVAIVLLLVAIFMPETSKMSLTVPDLAESTLIQAEVPVKVLFIILCGICTSVMWGVIFNLATEGLGKYTATASGLFMTMVVGGGVMPLIQNLTATRIGDIQSYWLVVAMLAYMLFYALAGSRPAKKD